MSPRTKATSPAVPATWERVLAHRVRVHHLDTPATGGLVPLVRQLSAVQLVELDVEGHRGWTTTAAAAAIDAAEPDGTVRLLPGFDPYVVGALRQLGHLVPAAGHKAAVSRASGWISPVLLHGGRILGTWSHEQAAGRLRVTVTPLTTLRPAVRGGDGGGGRALGRVRGPAPARQLDLT